jgi:hypothetical protein
MNNLTEHLKKIDGIKVSKSADNVVVWTSAKNNNKQQRTLENTMIHSPEVLNSWTTENSMIIRKSKTIYQFFSL